MSCTLLKVLFLSVALAGLLACTQFLSRAAFAQTTTTTFHDEVIEKALPDHPTDFPPDIRLPTEDEQETVNRKFDLMMSSFEARDFQSAQKFALEMLEIDSQTWGPENPMTAMSHFLIADQQAAYRKDDVSAVFHAVSAYRIFSSHMSTGSDNVVASILLINEILPRLLSAAEKRAAFSYIIEAAIITSGLSSRDAELEVALRRFEIDLLNFLGESSDLDRQYARSAHFFQKSFEVTSSLTGPESDESQIARVNLDLARSQPATRLLAEAREQASWFNFREAETLFLEAQEIYEKILGYDNPITLTSFVEFASMLKSIGRYEEAEKILTKTLSNHMSVHGERHPSTLNNLHNLATMLHGRKQYEEAEVFYRRTLAGYFAVYGPDSAQTAFVAGNLANLYLQTRNLVDAEHNLKISLRGMDDIGASLRPDFMWEYRNLGMIYREMGKVERSLAIFERLLNAPWADAHVLGSAHTRFELGKLYLQNGQFEKAIDTIRASLEGYQSQDVSTNSIEYLEAKEHLAEALGLSGRATEGFEAALSVLNFKLANTEKSNLVLGEANVRSGALPANTGQLVAHLAWAANQQAQLTMLSETLPTNDKNILRTEGFTAIQAANSLASFAVAQATARTVAKRSDLGDIALRWEAALAERLALNQKRTELVRNYSDDEEAMAAMWENLSRRHTDVNRRITDAERRLRTKLPRFFDLALPTAVTVEELQGSVSNNPLLKEAEALVLLSPPRGDYPGLVWAVSRDQVAWAEITLTPDELGQRLAALRANIDHGVNFDRSLALELYNALFGAPKIQAVLQNKSDWILAPQGSLLGLPFNVLVTDTPPNGPEGDADPASLRGTSWLGLERVLSVVPSVSSIRSLRRLSKENTSRADLDFFGVGDPNFEDHFYTTKNTRALADPDQILRLATLPNTRSEITSIAARFGVGPESVLLGQDASESNVAREGRGGAMSQARNIVFATHGMRTGVQGLREPALALSPPICDAKNRANVPSNQIDEVATICGANTGSSTNLQSIPWVDDGLLTASEVALLDLDADAVFLSACDTAAGETDEAEALSGLARAFFYAGARSLLVSHWPVRDDVAAQMTLDIVDRAEKGQSRPLALQEAMRAVMMDARLDADGLNTAHPRHWAPFQFTGVVPDI